MTNGRAITLSRTFRPDNTRTLRERSFASAGRNGITLDAAASAAPTPH